MKKLYLVGLALLGSLFSIGFIYPAFWFISLIVLTVFFYLERHNNQPFHYFVFFLFFHIFGIHWLIHPLRDYGHIHGIIANLLLILLSIYFALLYYFTVWCYQKFFNKKNSFVLAALLVIAEYTKYNLLGGFPFLLTGYLSTFGPLSAFIPYLGVFGSSYITYAGLISFINRKVTLNSIIFSALMVVVLSFTASLVMFTSPLKTITVGAIQTNINHFLENKNMEVYIQSQITRFKDVDIVIWPEGSMTFDIESLTRSNEQSFPLLIGGVIAPNHIDNMHKNLTIILNNQGKLLSTHQKHHLAQFNETIPDYLVPLLKLLNLPHIGAKRGSGGDVIFKSSLGNISQLICYELMFTDFLHQDSSNANIVLTMNDLSWFLGSSFNQQFKNIAQFNAQSIQKPIVVTSNFGSSYWINHRGNLIKELTPHSYQTNYSHVIMRKGTTPIEYIGDSCIILALFLLLIFYYMRFELNLFK